jgi:hypothetical protein
MPVFTNAAMQLASPRKISLRGRCPPRLPQSLIPTITETATLLSILTMRLTLPESWAQQHG